MSAASLLLTLLLSAVVPTTEAIFFFQDLKPASYRMGDLIDVHVGQLHSETSAN